MTEDKNNQSLKRRLPLGVKIIAIFGLLLSLFIIILPSWFCFGHCSFFSLTSIPFHIIGIFLALASILLLFRINWARISASILFILSAIVPLIIGIRELVNSQDIREFMIYVVISLIIFILPSYLLFNKKVKGAFNN